MVAQQRKWTFPLDAVNRRLWITLLGKLAVFFTLQEGQDGIFCFRAVKNLFKKADHLCPFGHGRGSTEGKAHAARVQVIRGFGKRSEKAFAGFWGQAVGYSHQVCVFLARDAQDLLHWHCRAKKDGAPAGSFGQTQEVHHARHVDAFAKGPRDNSLHSTSCSIVKVAIKVHDPYLLYRNSIR